MGNAGSNARERHKSGGHYHPQASPNKDRQKMPELVFQSSEEEAYNANYKYLDVLGPQRQRSATVSEGTKVNDEMLPTVFKWEGGGKQAFVSGTFSDWKTMPMVKSHGDFVTIIDLPEGEHQYKFLVDGEWKYDPFVKLVDNGMGSKNNVISVKKSDFEVFQALAMDSESSASTEQKEYSQELPDNKPGEKMVCPPILPPHLLQVILNKDTSLSCEPTLLPEPNHVMLNHLYALSIKDGTMVLSATHRYRKKCVTTLFYKPISP